LLRQIKKAIRWLKQGIRELGTLKPIYSYYVCLAIRR